MQIRSTRNLGYNPQRQPTPKSVNWKDALPAAGGTVLGGVSAALGYELASQYGPKVAHEAIDKGMKLMANGWISPDFALRALPYITSRNFQLQVGAIGFGLIGFATGAALMWPRD